MENRLPQITFTRLTVTSQENDEPPRYESPPSYESILLNTPTLHKTPMPCYPYDLNADENQQQNVCQNVQESNVSPLQQSSYRPHDNCTILPDTPRETFDYPSTSNMDYTNVNCLISNRIKSCKINSLCLKWWLKLIFDIATIILTLALANILQKRSFVHDRFSTYVTILNIFYLIFQGFALCFRLRYGLYGVPWIIYAIFAIAQVAFMVYIDHWRTISD